MLGPSKPAKCALGWVFSLRGTATHHPVSSSPSSLLTLSLVFSLPSLVFGVPWRVPGCYQELWLHVMWGASEAWVRSWRMITTCYENSLGWDEYVGWLQRLLVEERIEGCWMNAGPVATTIRLAGIKPVGEEPDGGLLWRATVTWVAPFQVLSKMLTSRCASPSATRFIDIHLVLFRCLWLFRSRSVTILAITEAWSSYYRRSKVFHSSMQQVSTLSGKILENLPRRRISLV